MFMLSGLSKKILKINYLKMCEKTDENIHTKMNGFTSISKEWIENNVDLHLTASGLIFV